MCCSSVFCERTLCSVPHAYLFQVEVGWPEWCRIGWVELKFVLFGNAPNKFHIIAVIIYFSVLEFH